MTNLSDTIEPKTKEFLEKANSAKGPALYELSPEEARKVMDGLQGDIVQKSTANVEDRTIPGGPKGDVSFRIVRPESSKELKDAKSSDQPLPVIIYIHGAGWVLGGWQTHDRLCLELANRVQAALVFVNYSLSPEAKYPVAIEESYIVAKWVAENAKLLNVDASRMAVAGDSVGGNMSIALAMMAKELNGPKFVFQCLFYPVTDANFETGSYKQFGENHFLTTKAMKWFWNQYVEESKRDEPKVCPLKATKEQLTGLPPALILTAEHDVLRDEGEAFAHKLSNAGVTVRTARVLGTIHDFVMLHVLAETPAAKLGIEIAADQLKAHLHKEAAVSAKK
ncbi:MAG: alpha/beta hydrolase [Leptolyngbya sp.]|nr:alpha/beta hydrolase [Candidatus Melainabacteria bacterium]